MVGKNRLCRCYFLSSSFKRSHWTPLLPHNVLDRSLPNFRMGTWRGSATGRALDLWSTCRGFKFYSAQKLRNNLGQVVHTYVPLPLPFYIIIWVDMINPSFFSRSLGHCYNNRFFAQIGENWHIPTSFCALAFDNGWENSNRDAGMLIPPTIPVHLIKTL